MQFEIGSVVCDLIGETHFDLDIKLEDKEDVALEIRMSSSDLKVINIFKEHHFSFGEYYGEEFTGKWEFIAE